MGFLFIIVVIVIVTARGIFWGRKCSEAAKRKINDGENFFLRGALWGIFEYFVIQELPDAFNVSSKNKTEDLLKKLSNDDYLSKKGQNPKEWWCPGCKVYNSANISVCKCGITRDEVVAAQVSTEAKANLNLKIAQLSASEKSRDKVNYDDGLDELFIEIEPEIEYANEESDTDISETANDEITKEAVESEEKVESVEVTAEDDNTASKEKFEAEIVERDPNYIENLLAETENLIEREIIKILSQSDYSAVEIIQHFPREEIYEYQNKFFEMVDKGIVVLKKYGKYSIWK